MPQDIAEILDVASEAGRQWTGRMMRERLQMVGRVAHQLVERSDELVSAIHRPNSSAAECLASEVLPLADACRFAAKQGRRALRPSSYSSFTGSWWMGRVGVRVAREPWGTVLILAPWNYPLLLPGVQCIQALAAGNAAVLKPSPGCERVLELLRECITAAGIPGDLVHILPATIQAAQDAIKLGVDKVILTGSMATGKAVAHQLADGLIPVTMELSGCDAVFVLPQADLKRVADLIAYGLRLNGGATCIAPRRIFVMRQSAQELEQLLHQRLADAPAYELHPAAKAHALEVIENALSAGAELVVGKLSRAERRDTCEAKLPPTVLRNVRPEMEIARSDVFAPVTSLIQVEDMASAVEEDYACPYSLGASVLGPKSHAEHWAERINAGCVVINDLIVPTADPRVPFGGRYQSGWGVTRGLEGLLAMTRPKAICYRRGSWLPHLDPQLGSDNRMMQLILRCFHSPTLKKRVTAFLEMVQHFQSMRQKLD